MKRKAAFSQRGRGRKYRCISRRGRVLRLLTAVCLCCVAVFCAVNLIRYALDARHARLASDALREVYYSPDTEPPSASIAPAPTATPTPAPIGKATAVPAYAPPPNMLPAVRYPDNPSAAVSSRFKKLQRQNSDIIGWLNIPDMLDEAVVQRDNSYYLNRDYRGYHNANGAIFLDEACQLDTRPYTLILYGHNMKTGAMFGNLRNYENLHYYKNNPFIAFDTAYEDGSYVIFSVATIDVTPGGLRYVDLAALSSLPIEPRQAAITALKMRSIYQSSLDVQADDQLLLLITCTKDDNERRVIAARRIRTDETREALNSVIQQTAKK